jgi:hypothetical protein
MRLAGLSLVVAAVSLLPISARGASATDPPTGIIPTAMTLTQLTALHKRAAGTLSRTRKDTWALVDGDLTGTQTYLVSGDDFREDTTLGPFHTARGSLGGHPWSQNANGLTVQLSGIHQRADVDREALASGAKQSGVSLLGEAYAPLEAYVVKVDPPDGQVEYIFYDAQSYLIVRTETAIEDLRIVDTFDDFRATNGVQRPWHIHESDGRQFNDRDWRLEASDASPTIAPNAFAVPPSDTSHFTLSSPSVVLPGKIIADRVILTAQVGRHKVDFQLDSGASQILLDQSVADALGLTAYGKETETTAGTYTARQAIVPLLDFNGAALHNVAVVTAPFQQWENDTTPVAGLLGFDFIANCVIHIDYFHGEAEALDASTFQAPAGAVAVPIRLDDDVPVITAKIAAVSSDRFVVDTGADRSLLFSPFVDAHPQAVADQGLGQEYEEAYPFLSDILGVGGSVRVTHTQVPSLTVGSWTFPQWFFSAVVHAPAFEGEDYDGLIGQDVLRNFDVYLDYPHLKIYFVPNDRYRQRWGS